MIDLTDTEEIKKIFKKYNLAPNKFMGQNFLVDKAVLGKIVEAAEISKGDNVLEIGPGLGALTGALLEAGAKVLAIEKDKKLAGVLRDLFGANKNLKIINADFLALDFEKLISDFVLRSSASKWEAELLSGYKVVSNLPYYITSPVIKKILSWENKPSRIVLLAQKEVAERICEKPGQMSFISVFVQFYAKPEIVEIVKPSSFWPKPKVDSAILKIIPREKTKISESEENELWRLVKIGFSSRRKTLANNLSAGLRLPREKIEGILKLLGFNEKIRAQELGVEDWVRLLRKLDSGK
ncbi:ribosomal RNA small subunit methyltransferase A [Patescibacteria group bacterium]|nr:ribosomal RNA small subunit methyltransferase A [Patescibacteria group bacterium]MBU3999619.1 ribosomal RNA small subunit methyltransferase A [Patescibacteria group bacterium]MBU4056384.1 ribosomal RNA small subunit methyltransferase A [Patescibacteria group bacterium]MBU4368949.1 ribosomal RNA small subunit methyltransferase A [Patescibacteria group bacterium]